MSLFPTPFSAITSEVKVAIAVILLVIIAGLTFGAVHYHSAWVSAKEEIATLKATQVQLETAAEDCSKGTEKLDQDAKAKAEEVKKAQEKATSLAKKNEALAQSLLNAKPEGDACKAAVKLYQSYKLEKEKK